MRVVIDFALLPRDFASLSRELPEGFTAAERVLDPELRIDTEGERIVARLVGIRVVRGSRIELAAPSAWHGWVVDGSVLRPLPKDVSEVLHTTLEGADPANVPYALAVRLLRAANLSIPVTGTTAFLYPARVVADQLPEAFSVPGLEAKLYPYQARGIQWMVQAIRRYGGLILADEMGLGKTLQVIGLLLTERPTEASPALIVCPTSLIVNWTRELARFAPDLSVVVHRGPQRTGTYRGLQRSRVVITTYETMVNDIAIFSAFEWSAVICDEAQALKNPDSNRRRGVVRLPRRASIAMTGTPVENTLVDLWSLADFVVPGVLGTRQAFESAWPDTVDAARDLALWTDPLVLMRRVVDVAGDLPPRLDIDVPLELDAALVERYRSIREETLARYPVAGALVATLQLQLFCAHPWLRGPDADDMDGEFALVERDTDLPIMTPKMERTVALLREAFSNSHKVLVFALFNRLGDIIREAGHDLMPAFWGAINGATPQADRQTIIDQFTAHEGPACLVLNPKAAGAGLNITAATVVIHLTPVWNPALETQASARAHRRGQMRTVTIYRLFYDNTVERVMLERSSWKRQMGNESVPTATRDGADLQRALAIIPEPT
jgi:SNF2 family DNA or RNA helicase